MDERGRLSDLPHRLGRGARAAMAAAGYQAIRVEELALRPAPAVCVLGRRPV